MTLPNFLIVGPPRCATTWLHAVLRTHPEIFLPEEKQLHFFDRQFDKGQDWYAAHFTGARPRHKAVGEVTPDYAGTPGTLERIAQTLDRVRLILVYRDPVERMFNHYAMKVRADVYDGTPGFLKALEIDDMLLRDSRYDRHLEHCEALFSSDRVFLADFAAFQYAPLDELRRIFAFLGVDPGHVPPAEISERQYAKDRPPSKSRIVSTGMRGVREAFERLPGGRALVNLARSTDLVDGLHRINSAEQELTLGDEDRAAAAALLPTAFLNLASRR